MCAILQLVLAPLNPRPIADLILGGATHYVSTVTEQTPAQESKTELTQASSNLQRII